MNARTLFAGAVLLCGAAAAQTDEQEMTDASYLLGYNSGVNFKAMGLELDYEVFVQAIQDAMNDTPMTLTPERQQAVVAMLEARQAEAMAKREEQMRAERAAAAEANLEQGRAFLAENAKREGVIVTESGLQYEILEMGDGLKPAAEDRVTVHYVGTLIDGTEFDSSVRRGAPMTFAVRGVIPGWVEGLQLMPVGSKFRFFIPSDLAYAGRGSGRIIGPNATLLFDVELIGIEGQ